MALASALASALSDAHATMAHAKVHEDYAAADPFSSPVPPSKQNAPPATVFKPTSSVTPPSLLERRRPPTSANRRRPWRRDELSERPLKEWKDDVLE